MIFVVLLLVWSASSASSDDLSREQQVWQLTDRLSRDELLYLTAESGDLLVLKAGPTFEVIEQNSLDESCVDTGDWRRAFLTRTHKHLVAIGRPAETGAANVQP